MEKILILFLIISTTLALDYKIDRHDELHGLTFEEIGSLKLITKIHSVNFFIDLSKIQNAIKEAEEIISESKKTYHRDTKFHKDLDDTKELIDLKKLEFLDITSDLNSIAVETKRKKRETLKDTLVTMRTYVGGVQGDVIKHGNDHLKTEHLNKNVTLDFKKKIVRQTLHTKIVAIENIIEAIIMVQMQNKLNNHLVSFEEFQNLLTNTTKENPLRENEEIPYDSIHKYFYNIKTTHEVNQNLLKLTFDIPIVEKTPRTLYKIQELPARFNSSLIITNVGWKFIARSDNYAMFHSLDDCLTNDTTYFCEPQSALNKDSSDCITKALNEKKIDEKICDLKFVEPKGISIVKLSNGKFFYFSPQIEKIKITCGKNETIEEISESGTISLSPGCSASHQNFKLVSQEKSHEFSVNKIFKTEFNDEEIRKRASGEISALEENIFYQNMEALQKIVKPKKKPPTLEKVVLASKISWWVWIVVAGGIIVGLIAAKFCKCAMCL